AVYDDGSGPALYGSGNIYSAGGVATKGIARWTGATWSPVAGGLSGGGYDDGSGPVLIAVGDFTGAGSTAAWNVARWSGSWSPLSAHGNGLSGSVNVFVS